MDLLTTARSPWGESVFVHISWSLFWASLVGGLLFLLAHGGYMLFSQPVSYTHLTLPTNREV